MFESRFFISATRKLAQKQIGIYSLDLISLYKKTGSKGCLFFYQCDRPFFLLKEYMESKKFFRQVFSDHCVDILEPKDGIVRPHAMPLGKIGGVVA